MWGDFLIGEILKELRKEKNLLQKDIAKYLNITTSAYGYYEQEKRSPDIEIIKKLADFFDVSTDYLLGRSKNRKNCIKFNMGIKDNDIRPLNYEKIEEKIIKRFLDEGIIIRDEPISEDIFDKILLHGVESAIEIIKLENKLKITRGDNNIK